MIKSKSLNLYSNYFVLLTILIVVQTVLIPLYYSEEIFGLGKYLINTYGQDKFDFVIFTITLISSTPLALPVWTYAVYGSMLGYDPIRIIMIVSLGAALGSGFTYMLGRYFARTRFVRKRFPNLENHPWAKGKSFLVISFLLCFGTVLPIPIDLFFAVCVAKKYPVLLFLLFVFIGKVITYAFFVYGWVYIKALGLF